MARLLRAMVLTLAVFGSISLPAAAASGDAVVRESGLLRVEAPANFDRYADSVLSHATAAMRNLNQATGDPLLAPVRFILAPDEATFLELAGNEGEQSLAVSLGGAQTVVVSRPAMMKAGADKILQVLTHELAHVYLDVRCRGAVPRWVHEGVAQLLAGEWTDGPGDATLTIAAYTGGLIPLAELVQGFPLDVTRRQMAYAEAYSAVRFLVREDHSNSPHQFLRRLSGDDGREYLRTLSGGVELMALQKRWQTELRSPLAIAAILLGNGFFWGLSAALVIAAWFVVRRRSRVIRSRWAAEEAEAAEWNEPPHEAEWTYLDSTPDDDENPVDEDWEGEEWKRGGLN